MSHATFFIDDDEEEDGDDEEDDGDDEEEDGDDEDEDEEGEDVCTEIIVVTGNYGNENSFSFGSCNSTQEYPSYNTTIEICCQPAGTYELVCTDTYGDGWHGGYIEVEGMSYCGDFTAGHNASHEVEMTGKLKFRDKFLSPK